MRKFISSLLATLAVAGFLACNSVALAAEAPTSDIVQKVLREAWEKPATKFAPKCTLVLNSVKFGKPYKATAQEVQVEGLPDGANVTPAIIDFTLRTFYNSETQVLRRVREATVYRDKFEEWAVMTGSARGEDQRTTEPVEK